MHHFQWFLVSFYLGCCLFTKHYLRIKMRCYENCSFSIKIKIHFSLFQFFSQGFNLNSLKTQKVIVINTLESKDWDKKLSLCFVESVKIHSDTFIYIASLFGLFLFLPQKWNFIVIVHTKKHVEFVLWKNDSRLVASPSSCLKVFFFHVTADHYSLKVNILKAASDDAKGDRRLWLNKNLPN